MSIFYRNRRRRVLDNPPLPTLAQYEAAIAANSDGLPSPVVANALGRSVEDADKLIRVCDRLEGGLLPLLADNTLDTNTKTQAWLVENAPAWFPTNKFLAVLKDNAGGTFAKLVTEAKLEMASTATPATSLD